MDQYITSSSNFGIKRQLFQLIGQIKSEIMPCNSSPGFRSVEMDSNSTYSDSDLVEGIIKYLYNADTKMEQLAAIRGYFYRFPEIAELSCEVSDLVHLNFDSKTQLSLEVRGETDSESEYLALCIRMNDYDDSVMERIRSIREEYAENLADMSGWFLLTTDYMPPR